MGDALKDWRNKVQNQTGSIWYWLSHHILKLPGADKAVEKAVRATNWAARYHTAQAKAAAAIHAAAAATAPVVAPVAAAATVTALTFAAPHAAGITVKVPLPQSSSTVVPVVLHDASVVASEQPMKI